MAKPFGSASAFKTALEARLRKRSQSMGVPFSTVAIPKAQQFAEKLHAYTFPWAGRQNTRSKDLVDLVLLIERGIPDVGRIRAALSATFSTRATHSLPNTLPSPPDSWALDFRGMAEEANISTADVLLAFAVLERFWAENGFGQERP